MDARVREAGRLSEGGLFFRRWLANPMKVGAVLPSSVTLARLVAENVRVEPDNAVVELGAGTGAVTDALLTCGVDPRRLFVIELDARLCEFLRGRFPSTQIIQGDAMALERLLPERWVGRVSMIVSSLPMVNISADRQSRLIDGWFSVATPDARLLQYTYSLRSPIKANGSKLIGRRAAIAVKNFPPASIWSYRRSA